MATFGNPVQSMVAERGDGSSQQIDTGAEEYNDWAYIMKSYLSCIAQKFREILGVVEALDEKGVSEQLLMAT